MMNNYLIGIIVCDGVLTSEVMGPAEVFALAGQQDANLNIDVLFIGLEDTSFIVTGEGIKLGVDANIRQGLDLDVLLVPGGSDMEPLLQNETLHALLKKYENSSTWLGSVCSGAFVLGQAGVLNGKRATTYNGGENSLQSQFSEIRVVHDKTVIVDKRRLTADGGLVSYQAALVLLGHLTSAKHAKRVYDLLGLERLSTWSEIEETIGASLHV